MILRIHAVRVLLVIVKQIQRTVGCVQSPALLNSSGVRPQGETKGTPQLPSSYLGRYILHCQSVPFALLNKDASKGIPERFLCYSCLPVYKHATGAP